MSHVRPPGPTEVPRSVVLLADDAADVREMYRLWMELSEFDVLEAADGLQAIDLARQHRPHAIVMDLSMPLVDGWEACRRLKADPRTRHIPIIALSAHGYADAQRRALEAGCDHFVAKPCAPDTLEDSRRRVLSNRPDIPA
ncbi:MAG: response regulator [Vicinamibacterales bacterium]